MELLTLSQAATYVAGRLNMPLSDQLKEELKFGILHWRSVIIRRDFERNGASPHYVQSFIAKLQIADKYDSCVVTSGCKLLKSTIQIPVPVRTKGNYPFLYLGSLGAKLGFEYTTPEDYQLRLHSKFTAHKIYYAYENFYIYVYNNLLLTYFLVRSSFENPEEICNLCCDNSCFYEDQKFPLPMDMLEAIITGLITKEFSLTQLKDLEVPVVTQENKR